MFFPHFIAQQPVTFSASFYLLGDCVPKRNPNARPLSNKNLGIFYYFFMDIRCLNACFGVCYRPAPHNYRPLLKTVVLLLCR